LRILVGAPDLGTLQSQSPEDQRGLMKVVITGAAGWFGHGLYEAFRARHTAFPLTRIQADITKPNKVRSAFAKFRPGLVIHAAGSTPGRSSGRQLIRWAGAHLGSNTP
jgi:nucleoside-diphosphate-sugar epimerase